MKLRRPYIEARDSAKRALRPSGGGSLDKLDADCLSYALSFCDACSLSTFGGANHYCRQVGRSTHLWGMLCLKAWDLPLETPLASLAVSKRKVGLSSLYKHIRPWPRKLDMPGAAAPAPQNAEEEAPQPQVVQPPAFRVIEKGVVQYTGGQPGVGNRSVRSAHPFPSLPDSDGSPHMCTTGVQGMIDHMSRMLSCLCQPRYPICGVPGLGQGPAEKAFKVRDKTPPAFSTPWMRGDGRLDVTPRSLAYYEVTIRHLEQKGPPSHHAEDDENSNSCVAVGLAPGDFPLEGMMPGWSKCSYALHSDDGAIFHAAGIKLRYFSSSFGPGDTVGCGIDYATREIFFTLNGAFLGVAFRDVKGTLYPTVGIDALHPIAINFGHRAFAFEIDSYAAAREAWLARSGPDAHAE